MTTSPKRVSSRVRSWSNAVLPVLAVALAAVATAVPRWQADHATTDSVSVSQSTYVCPRGQSGATAALGQLVAGTSRSVAVSTKGAIESDTSDAAAWTSQQLAGDGAIVTQDGRGSGAVGFTAGTASKSAGRGLVVARCGGVVDEAWFLGLGTADKRSSTLVLSNLSDTPAVADVMLWNPKGVVDAVHAKGISVEPFTIRRIPISDLAAGEPDLAAQVVRRRGVMAAMVEDSSTATYAGTEAIGAAQPPSRDQVIAGVDGQKRGKKLLLLNPGRQTARVDVTTYTADGPVADADLQGLEVKAGRYLTVDVPGSVGAGQHGLRVTSDRAIVASARVSPDVKDFMLAESAPLLDGPAVVPVDLGSAVPARLILSALDDAATVDVVAYDAKMQEIGRTTVDIGARSTLSTKVSDIKADGKVAYLTVDAHGGVVGAVTYTSGSRSSSLALRSAPTSIDVPVVLPD